MEKQKNPSVTVLLSTYNGEKYIGQQLDSIYKQKDIDLRLFVRDDGSTDSTQSILNAEQAKGKLTWYTGDNLKPAYSFWDLLCNAPSSDYYAFADQDDYWMEDKLSAACKQLHEHEGPALYFAQTQLADENLNPLPSVKIHPLLTYGEALIHQFVGGCTMVLNDAMRKILISYRPEYLQMHDFWIYDVALAVGAYVYFDPTPRMLYRQHGHNAVGQLNSKRFVWQSRMKRLREQEHIRLRTAKELWNGYKDLMPQDNKSLTKDVISYRNNLMSKWKVMHDERLKCSLPAITFSTKIAFLLNIF